MHSERAIAQRVVTTTSLIGTNRACAVETVGHLLRDRDVGASPRAPLPAPSAVPALLRDRGVAYVTLEQWLALDRHEQALGQAQGRRRVKLLSREAMLRVAHSTAPAAAAGDAWPAAEYARSA